MTDALRLACSTIRRRYHAAVICDSEPEAMMERAKTILIEGGRVYDQDGDTDLPAIQDVLIVGDRLAAIEPGIGQRLAAGEHVAALADMRRGRDHRRP